MTAATAPPGATAAAPTVAQQRDRLLRDRSRLLAPEEVAKLIHRSEQTIRTMSVATRKAIKAGKPLGSNCMPYPDSYMFPGSQRNPRWYPETILRWALGQDPAMPEGYSHRLAWAGPDSAELVPYREHRGNSSPRVNIATLNIERYVQTRDKVIAEYRRQLRKHTYIVHARKATAETLGLDQLTVKRLIRKAARLPEYGDLPEARAVGASVLRAEHERLLGMVAARYRKARDSERRAGATSRATKRALADGIAAELGLSVGTVLNMISEAGLR